MTSKPEKQAIEETLKKIKTDHSVASIASPFEIGTISKDGSVAYADITYKKRRMTLRMRLFHILNTVCPPQETKVCRRSSAAMCRVGVEIGGVSEIVGVVLAFVVLAITFGSLVIAGLPIVTTDWVRRKRRADVNRDTVLYDRFGQSLIIRNDRTGSRD